MFKACL